MRLLNQLSTSDSAPSCLHNRSTPQHCKSTLYHVSSRYQKCQNTPILSRELGSWLQTMLVAAARIGWVVVCERKTKVRWRREARQCLATACVRSGLREWREEKQTESVVCCVKIEESVFQEIKGKGIENLIMRCDTTHLNSKDYLAKQKSYVLPSELFHLQLNQIEIQFCNQ